MKNNTQKMLRAVTFVMSAILLGVSARGSVLPGNSSLISTLDYTDTFTTGGGLPPRDLNYYYNGDSSDVTDHYYNIETTYHGLSSVQWRQTKIFCFVNAAGTASNDSTYPGSTGNPGADTGRARASGGMATISYGVRSDYVVQADALMPINAAGTLTFSSYVTSPGSTWSGYTVSPHANLTVRFFKSGEIYLIGNATAPGVVTKTDTGFTTGLAADDSTWHNFAVRFNQTDWTVSFYVDEVLRGAVDTTTFASGIYEGWYNGAVGFGGDSYQVWVDNFQVGSAIPEPSTMALISLGGLLAVYRRR